MWSFSIEQVPSISLHNLPPPCPSSPEMRCTSLMCQYSAKEKRHCPSQLEESQFGHTQTAAPKQTKKSHQTAMQISLFTAVWNYNEHTALPCFQCPAVSVRMPVAGCQHCCPLHRPASLGTWSPLHIPTMPTGWIWWLLCLLSDWSVLTALLWMFGFHTIYDLCGLRFVCAWVSFICMCAHTHTHTHTHSLSLTSRPTCNNIWRVRGADIL